MALSNKVIWQGLKSAVLAIFQSPDGCAHLVQPSRIPHWISKNLFVLGSYARRQSWKGLFLLGFNLVNNQCAQQRCFEKWTEYKYSQGKSCRSTGNSVFIYRDFCAVPCSTLYGILVYSTDYNMPLVFGVVYPYLQSFPSSILRISVCNVIKSTEAFSRSALAFG